MLHFESTAADCPWYHPDFSIVTDTPEQVDCLWCGDELKTKPEEEMTEHEQQLLEKYLTHLNILGDEGCYDSFEEWYQQVRFARGHGAPLTLEEASELRYKDVLAAARVFNRLVAPGPELEAPEFPIYVGWDGQEHGEY